VGLITDPGREIKPTIKKDEGPKSIESEGFSAPVLQWAEGRTCANVESINLALSKVAYEQDVVTKPTKLVTKFTELLGYSSQAPR